MQGNGEEHDGVGGGVEAVTARRDGDEVAGLE
jgi:hypothetical protein